MEENFIQVTANTLMEGGGNVSVSFLEKLGSDVSYIRRAITQSGAWVDPDLCEKIAEWNTLSNSLRRCVSDSEEDAIRRLMRKLSGQEA